jgi:hypothetical protein
MTTTTMTILSRLYSQGSVNDDGGGGNGGVGGGGMGFHYDLELRGTLYLSRVSSMDLTERRRIG